MRWGVGGESVWGGGGGVGLVRSLRTEGCAIRGMVWCCGRVEERDRAALGVSCDGGSVGSKRGCAWRGVWVVVG